MIGKQYKDEKGDIYTVLILTNTDQDRFENSHVDVVYLGQNGNIYSARLIDWKKSFTEVTNEDSFWDFVIRRSDSRFINGLKYSQKRGYIAKHDLVNISKDKFLKIKGLGWGAWNKFNQIRDEYIAINKKGGNSDVHQTMKKEKVLLHDNQRGFQFWKSWYEGKMKIANPILEEFEKEFEGVIKLDNDLTRRLIGDPMRFIDTVLTDAIVEYAGKQRFIEDAVRKNLLENAYKFYDNHLRAFPFTMPSSADVYNSKMSDASWYECEYFEITGNRLTLSEEYEAKAKDSFRNYVEGDAAEDFARIQAFEEQLNNNQYLKGRRPMNNPFEDIHNRLDDIYELINKIIQREAPLPPEIIDRKTLISRLDISEPTAIRWQQKGKIPYLKIGSAIRYDWIKVIQALSIKERDIRPIR